MQYNYIFFHFTATKKVRFFASLQTSGSIANNFLFSLVPIPSPRCHRQLERMALPTSFNGGTLPSHWVTHHAPPHFWCSSFWVEAWKEAWIRSIRPFLGPSLFFKIWSHGFWKSFFLHTLRFFSEGRKAQKFRPLAISAHRRFGSPPFESERGNEGRGRKGGKEEGFFKYTFLWGASPPIFFSCNAFPLPSFLSFFFFVLARECQSIKCLLSPPFLQIPPVERHFLF